MTWESVKNSGEACVFCIVLIVIGGASPPYKYGAECTSLPRVFDTPSSHSNFDSNSNPNLNSKFTKFNKIYPTCHLPYLPLKSMINASAWIQQVAWAYNILNSTGCSTKCAGICWIQQVCLGQLIDAYFCEHLSIDQLKVHAWKKNKNQENISEGKMTFRFNGWSR